MISQPFNSLAKLGPRRDSVTSGRKVFLNSLGIFFLNDPTTFQQDTRDSISLFKKQPCCGFADGPCRGPKFENGGGDRGHSLWHQSGGRAPQLIVVGQTPWGAWCTSNLEACGSAMDSLGFGGFGQLCCLFLFVDARKVSAEMKDSSLDGRFFLGRSFSTFQHGSNALVILLKV